MTEPTHYRTVSIRAVMPPKPEPQTLAPAISMAEDAKRVNARYRKTWGGTNALQANANANASRTEQGIARRAALADRVAAILAEGPARTGTIRERLEFSHEQTRRVMRDMKESGRAINFKSPTGAWLWRLA